jgi:hypothetical protein
LFTGVDPVQESISSHYGTRQARSAKDMLIRPEHLERDVLFHRRRIGEDGE